MTIGMYETPIWGKKGWLTELKTDAAYDVDDLLPAMRNGPSVDGKLFAAPFYGESSMLMYRKNLANKTGVKVSDKLTWTEVTDLAAKIHDPRNGVYGICLLGKPGWGDNMGAVSLSQRARTPFFLPYLSGERTPHNDPKASGVLVGQCAKDW